MGERTARRTLRGRGPIVVLVIVAAFIGLSECSGGTRTSGGTSAQELAAFACSELRKGTPESEVTQFVASRASSSPNAELRDVLRRIEDRCPELLE
jgi:hypothetical protein